MAERDADPARRRAPPTEPPVFTLADGPAALRRPARDLRVDLCAELRRIQGLAAAARQLLQRTPRGRRNERLAQLVGELDTATAVAADMVAEAARAQ